MLKQTKKTIAILLAFIFVMSVSAATVSAAIPSDSGAHPWGNATVLNRGQTGNAAVPSTTIPSNSGTHQSRSTTVLNGGQPGNVAIPSAAIPRVTVPSAAAVSAAIPSVTIQNTALPRATVPSITGINELRTSTIPNSGQPGNINKQNKPNEIQGKPNDIRGSFGKNGFNINGFDKYGFDKDGFNRKGFDKNGFNRNGFDKNGHKRVLGHWKIIKIKHIGFKHHHKYVWFTYKKVWVPFRH
jgi:hypothetical protein